MSTFTNVYFIDRQRAGQHEIFVTPSQWTQKLAIELGADPFILFVRHSMGFLDTEYFGLYNIQHGQHTMQEQDTSMIPLHVRGTTIIPSI